MIAILLNILIIVLELVGLWMCIPTRKAGVFAFYTQNSNLCALISSVLFLFACVFPQLTPAAAALRYLAGCMLAMTFCVVMFVLIPMGAGVKPMLLEKNCLLHHVLCPVVSVVSYLCFEPHASAGFLWLPPAVTLAYGIIMMYLNHLEKYVGPYPFFRVNRQSKKATVLWTAVLFASIFALSFLLMLPALV